MIQLTRLSREIFWLNDDTIEIMEKTPDTTLTLVTGKKLMVEESIDEVTRRIIEYKRKIYSDPETRV